MAIFTDVFEDVTKQGRKIPTSDYHESGLHPIIDQGQSEIAGYTDEENGLFTDIPAIIFGDHTRVLKYVDTPCFLGADGVKLLKAKIANPNYKYLYYVLSNANIPNTGYNRHFKWLKEVEIPLPSESEQWKIVEIMDKISELIALRKEQHAKLDQLVKSRFIELFGDPIVNPMNWKKLKLVDVCTKLTDGTHFSPESYPEGEYRYVTAKNIKIDGFDFSNITYVPKSVHDEIYARCNPEYGDVLYIKDGVTTGIAMVNTLHEPFTMLSSVALLKQNRTLLEGAYLCGVLNNQNMYDAIRKDMGGAAITRLTIVKLKNIQIPMPPLELQTQFAAFVEQTEKSKLAIQQSLVKLELLKKALMQEYFG